MSSTRTAILDILGPETLDTFNYAKLLKTHGYVAVFTVGNKVMAKMTEVGRPVIIRSKDHVDGLLELMVNPRRTQTPTT